MSRMDSADRPEPFSIDEPLPYNGNYQNDTSKATIKVPGLGFGDYDRNRKFTYRVIVNMSIAIYYNYV